MKAKSSNNIIIGESSIPWSFVWQTHAECGSDWDTTIDAFWKARNCKGKNGVQRYILCGFRHVNKYSLQASKEKESGKMESIREWWLQLYERKRDSSKECADMVAMLTGAFGMPADVLCVQKNGTYPVKAART
jgi:hypothetical protein